MQAQVSMLTLLPGQVQFVKEYQKKFILYPPSSACIIIRGIGGIEPTQVKFMHTTYTAGNDLAQSIPM